jgi:hypothetical protein
MHAPNTLFLTSILALLFSTITAAPAPAVPEICVVRPIAFSTIASPFTLSALTLTAEDPNNNNNIEWPVQLDPPSATRTTEPFISRTKIAQPLFRLTNGNLTTGGTDHDQFAAYFGPTIQIFPPVLQPVQFGGISSASPGFSAVFNCDAEGNTFLELRTFQRKFFFKFLNSKFSLSFHS